MKVAFACSECFPFVKTGGLGDVCGSLPKYISDLGCDVKVFLPLYGGIQTLKHNLLLNEDLTDIPLMIGDVEYTFNVWEGKLPNSEVKVYFIDCPFYFHRETPYTNDKDEDERFILFQQAVLITIQYLKWSPDIIHCNDWQTGLIPAYIRTTYAWDKIFENTKSIISIHNIGFQGRFSPESLYNANLPIDKFYPFGPFELNNSFCFLKSGIIYADLITTVSPTYAKEIQTEEFGAGLEGVLQLRANDLYGILNGIDLDVWNPLTDHFIKTNYSVEDIENKEDNKKNLINRIEFVYNKDIPVFGIISRLTGQKGFDLLKPILHHILENNDIQLVVLGSGELQYEELFKSAQYSFPEKVFFWSGYNTELSHLITAGADIFLMPSHYEPCGLNQMYSLNYGTVPIVRDTGGLADTVKDYHEHNESGNGFSFKDYLPDALEKTIQRALYIYKDKKIWNEIMIRGMKEDFSWKHSAEKYLDLYKKIIN
ncbi:MAG TPA: glycogen synthase GlgA [Ignavibacteria bacterium]|nr:glycogen synthase GlgA [Ignavibacteria bacterium]